MAKIGSVYKPHGINVGGGISPVSPPRPKPPPPPTIPHGIAVGGGISPVDPEPDYPTYPVAPGPDWVNTPSPPPDVGYGPPPDAGPPVFDPTPAPPPPPVVAARKKMTAAMLQSLIRGSSVYSGALDAANAARGNQRSQISGGIRQALIDAGLIPDFGKAREALGGLGDLWNNISPEDIAAAQRNPYSAQAQIDQADKEARRDLMSGLASRGMVRSGAAEYGLNRQSQARGQAESNLASKYLDYLQGQQGQYLTGESQRADSLQSALQQAAQLMAQLYSADYDMPDPNEL